MKGPGRNDSCPCGSTKKYKKCCVSVSRAQSSGQCETCQFEPATCRLVDGRFVPSIVLFGRIEDPSTHHGLVRRDVAFDSQEMAYEQATSDLDDVLESTRDDCDVHLLALCIAASGYQPVLDKKVALEMID